MGSALVRCVAILALSVGVFGSLPAAGAAECRGNPDALGTSRVLTIDPAVHPAFGTIQYPHSLPLADREVVLTFDDGPLHPYSERILEALAAECVKANYFIVGRMARSQPDLVRRIHAQGHVIGTHSENHPFAFDRLPAATMRAEIDKGIEATTAALSYTTLGDRDAVAPFFRVPGLRRSPDVEAYLGSLGIATWSADIVADDWRGITADEIVRRAMSRLDAKGRGIILLHDIQPATALAMPALLRQLKAGGYRIVLVKAVRTESPLIATAPRVPGADDAPALLGLRRSILPDDRRQPVRQVARQTQPAKLPQPLSLQAPWPLSIIAQ